MADKRRTINGVVVGGPCNIRHSEEKPIRVNTNLDISRKKDLPLMDDFGIDAFNVNVDADADVNIGVFNGRINISIKL